MNLRDLDPTAQKVLRKIHEVYQENVKFEIRQCAEELHDRLMEMRDFESFDGDETEKIADYFLDVLNELNGNVRTR